MKSRQRALGLSLILILTGCGTAHIRDYEPKKRDYELPAKAAEADAKGKEEAKVDPYKVGSLWSGKDGRAVSANVRTFELNDVLTVEIVEIASAQQAAETAAGRSGDLSAGAGYGANLPAGSLAQQYALAAQSGYKWKGTGRTSRKDDIRFKVAATVTRILDNGNLFVEGHRVVMVNNEESHFYVSGVARPQDIETDNSILSTRLADAQIEATGVGQVAKTQQQGWLGKLLDMASPF